MTGSPPVAWVMLVGLILACLVAGWYGAGWEADNRVAIWVGDAAESRAFSVLQERFGGDEAVVVRVDGFDLAQPEDAAWMKQLGERMFNLPAVQGGLDLFQLPGVPSELSEEQLIDLAERPLVQAFGLVRFEPLRLDYLLGIVPDSGGGDREAFVAGLRELEREGESFGIRMRAAGHPLLTTALEEEAAKVEFLFSPLLALVALLGTALFLRSLPFAILALLPAILASVGVRAGLHAADLPSNLILVAISPIVFVLVLASSLHLITAFRRLRAEGLDPVAAARAAVREKLAAGLLAGGTTAVGFGVFVFSPFEPVRRLGIALALTLVVIIPLLFILIPPILAGLPLKAPAGLLRSPARWRRIAALSARHRSAVFLLAGVVLIGGVVSPWLIPSGVNALHYFPQGHPVRTQFLTIEAEGGALSTMEILVRKRNGTPWSLDELATDELEAELATVPEVTEVLGPAVVARDLRSIHPRFGMVAYEAALSETKRLDASRTWLRYTLRFPTFDAEPTREVFQSAEAKAKAWGQGREVEILATGSVPLVVETQDTLVGTLALSVGLTALVTALLLCLVVRSPREFLAGLIANLTPAAGALFATLVFGYHMSGATVMVAAVVLGLAVDNTFHLLHAGGSGLRRKSPKACLRAFERVGEAAAVSSAALALGFATLGLSGFAPTAQFGLLTAVGAITALMGDLIVLPAVWLDSDLGPKTQNAPVSSEVETA